MKAASRPARTIPLFYEGTTRPFPAETPERPDLRAEQLDCRDELARVPCAVLGAVKQQAQHCRWKTSAANRPLVEDARARPSAPACCQTARGASPAAVRLVLQPSGRKFHAVLPLGAGIPGVSGEE